MRTPSGAQGAHLRAGGAGPVGPYAGQPAHRLAHDVHNVRRRGERQEAGHVRRADLLEALRQIPCDQAVDTLTEDKGPPATADVGGARRLR